MPQTIQQSRLEQYSSLEFLARQVVEGFITGLHKSPFHGFSVEFAEHRLYNPGESIRSIDWKLYGRTDRLYTKRYEEETNLRCQVFLDNSSSMYYPVLAKPDIDHPNKITFSVYMAAALIYLFHRQRDAAGVSLFSDTVELHTQTRSNTVHHRYLFSELEKMLVPRPPEQHKGTNVAKTIHELAERIHKRSLVIIFSDMFDRSGKPDEVFSALQHLRHNKHEVILFHVVDRKMEMEFAFDDRPYKFIDLESGEHLRVHPSALRERYVESLTRFRNELKVKCGQYRIDLIEADIHAGFEQVLLPYLVKRSRLF
ncbi:MAG TPA: DUF58 domain-containing protein [Bacteroidales bacterium]|nr:DUF58 domain-containing protein [Bacteroidales bacterium]HPS63816.1 DUF58 domain-containing protein [Bacteroidales bacterium]